MTWLRKVRRMLLPWPLKAERHEAIRSARRERLRSEHSAVKAAEIETQLRQMLADNHFADMLARQIAKDVR